MSAGLGVCSTRTGTTHRAENLLEHRSKQGKNCNLKIKEKKRAIGEGAADPLPPASSLLVSSAKPVSPWGPLESSFYSSAPPGPGLLGNRCRGALPPGGPGTRDAPLSRARRPGPAGSELGPGGPSRRCPVAGRGRVPKCCPAPGEAAPPRTPPQGGQKGRGGRADRGRGTGGPRGGRGARCRAGCSPGGRLLRGERGASGCRAQQRRAGQVAPAPAAAFPRRPPPLPIARAQAAARPRRQEKCAGCGKLPAGAGLSARSAPKQSGSARQSRTKRRGRAGIFAARRRRIPRLTPRPDRDRFLPSGRRHPLPHSWPAAPFTHRTSPPKQKSARAGSLTHRISKKGEGRGGEKGVASASTAPVCCGVETGRGQRTARREHREGWAGLGACALWGRLTGCGAGGSLPGAGGVRFSGPAEPSASSGAARSVGRRPAVRGSR